MIAPHSTSHVWRQLLRDLIEHGDEVSPSSAGANWRGRTTLEMLGHRTIIPMNDPVVLSANRKLGLKFLVAEAAWIAQGDNRVATIAPYAPIIKKFSDDGVRFFGAYGPRFVDQLSYATKCLRADPASRQAVIEVWREQPRSSNDVPCTLSWQWMIRQGRLHCVATMRSSDAWTGWVYDVFNFSVLSAIVALELRAWINPDAALLSGKTTRPYADLALGNLYFTAGSQHLYKIDVEAARACAFSEGIDSEFVTPKLLDLAEFESSGLLGEPPMSSGDRLIAHLWRLARGDRERGAYTWLRELFP